MEITPEYVRGLVNRIEYGDRVTVLDNESVDAMAVANPRLEGDPVLDANCICGEIYLTTLCYPNCHVIAWLHQVAHSGEWHLYMSPQEMFAEQ